MMEIRQVHQNEITGVLALIDEYDRPRSPWPSEAVVGGIYETIRASGGCVVGAFLGGNIVGTCTVNLCANLSWSGRPYAIIENVIVAKAYRSQGIGKAVLRYATKFAEDAGCYKVALMTGSRNPATHKFYESAGFSGNKQGYQIRFNA